MMNFNIGYRFTSAVYERSDKNFFWSIKILVRYSKKKKKKNKLRGFCATSLSTYDFSTLYTPLPHNLIIEKHIDFLSGLFKRECSLYLACYERNAFFTSEHQNRYKHLLCQKM